jgi:hypothetical protein
MADLVCNECSAILCSVPLHEVDATLLRLAMEEGLCSEVCSECGETSLFPGFTSMEAFTCKHCGAGVVVRRRSQ